MIIEGTRACLWVTFNLNLLVYLVSLKEMMEYELLDFYSKLWDEFFLLKGGWQSTITDDNIHFVCETNPNVMWVACMLSEYFAFESGTSCHVMSIILHFTFILLVRSVTKDKRLKSTRLWFLPLLTQNRRKNSLSPSLSPPLTWKKLM